MRQLSPENLSKCNKRRIIASEHLLSASTDFEQRRVSWMNVYDSTTSHPEASNGICKGPRHTDTVENGLIVFEKINYKKSN